VAIADRTHDVSIVVNERQIVDWIAYDIESSLITPADRFTMRRAFDSAIWNLLPTDSRVQVLIDRVVVLDGFIERRKKHGKENEIEISGTDRGGRLFQESAPAINYEGLELSEAVRRLVDPWYTKVTLSDARNRRLRLGKGFKVTSGAEPIYVHKKVKRAGKVHPGTSRWAAIEELCADAGYAAWGSADGREFFIGQPNQRQAAQFAVRLGKPGGVETTVKDLSYEEDVGDGYSVIAVVGTGGGTEQDFGETVSSRRAVVFDNEANKVDGTGEDFIYPKRLLMPEKNFESNDDASAVAGREQLRRDFRRRVVTATMPMHGQFLSAGAPTIFATNTMAYVVDEEFDPPLRADFLIFSCHFACDRQGAETTMLEMVPRGTDLVT
jgi:prophage tail gpP-like protein